MTSLVVHTLTDDQFQALLADRNAAVEREKRSLELAEMIFQKYVTLLSGLKHFSREEVAELLHCSVRQLYEYERLEKLIPRKIMGKVVYPADRLLEFLKTYDQTDMAATVAGHVSNFPTRKRTR